jgi:hypothetical protein
MKCRIKCRMSSVVSDVGLNKHLRKMVIEKVQFPSVKEHFQVLFYSSVCCLCYQFD